MPGDNGVLADVACAILDGKSIDWTSAESSADDNERSLLDPLRLVAAVADLHRQLPGETPGQWVHLRVLEQVGQGTFGRVYRAWDTRLDREVALKLMPAGPRASDPRATSIIEEGRLLARIRHPNVVSIYGAERTDDQVGLWMEFIHGRTLEQLIQDGHVFDQQQAIDIGIQLCRAVDAVHQAGLLHRDIKAHNVMLTHDQRVVLMDFGTGREVGEGRVAIAGTPLYLAPEVLAGSDATPASDIYAIGVVLYHLVTASYPVQADNLADLRRAHEQNLRADLSSARPDLGAKLHRIIHRAIDPQPPRRQPNAAALARDLESILPRSIRMPLRYVAVAASLLVLVAWLAAELRNRQSTKLAASAPIAAGMVPSVADQPIIAVLPLKNLSAEPNGYFVDGLTDELIRNLAVIEGLQVRSRTSSFALGDQPRNLREIGEQLGVNLVVEGSVLRTGNSLRVNAQLVQVAGDTPLWSDRFDRELKDVFAIQDEISRAIVNKLRLTLGRGQRRYDTNVEAYELYLKGRALVDRKGVPALEEAAKFFEAAIAKDHAFAPAHAGLAMTYALMSAPTGSTLTFANAHAVLRPAAVKALELDPLLADAHAAMGWVHSREHDWAGAEHAFERAIELNPSLTQTYISYSIAALPPQDKHEKALQVLQAALRNDPLSLDVQRAIGSIYLYAGRYHEAIETLQRVVAVDPDFPFAEGWLGRALMYAGRLEESLPLLEKSDGRNLGRFRPLQRPPYLAYLYVLTGRRADAETLLADSQRSTSGLAIIYAALGDKDRTFEALEQVAAVRPHHVAQLLKNPEMAVLRGDQRLVALRARLGLPPQP